MAEVRHEVAALGAIDGGEPEPEPTPEPQPQPEPEPEPNPEPKPNPEPAPERDDASGKKGDPDEGGPVVEIKSDVPSVPGADEKPGVIRSEGSEKPAPAPVRIDPAPIVEPGPGELVIVELKSGVVLTGVLLEASRDVLVLESEGVSVRLDRSEVLALKHKPTRYDEYARLRASIPPDDVPGTVVLVRWLLEQELLDEALREAELLSEMRPHDPDVAKLLRETSATVALMRKRMASEERDLFGVDGAGPGERRERIVEEIEAVRFGPDEFPTLTREQINLIKVYEINLRNPPRVRVLPATVDRLFAEYAGHPLIPESRRAREAFKRRPPIEILDVMFRAQARSLYGDVQVVGNPAAMERFRDDVHGRWLINSCASTRCHGGKGAGRFVLRNRRRGTEETFYTNFVILDGYRTEQGVALLNWSDPAMSPLFHYALPREDALFPHPPVDGWAPAIQSRSHRNWEDALSWMRSMYLPRPDYGIDYESPTDRIERLMREREEAGLPPLPPGHEPDPGGER